MRKKKWNELIIALMVAMVVCGCGKTQETDSATIKSEINEEVAEEPEEQEPEYETVTYSVVVASENEDGSYTAYDADNTYILTLDENLPENQRAEVMVGAAISVSTEVEKAAENEKTEVSEPESELDPEKEEESAPVLVQVTAVADISEEEAADLTYATFEKINGFSVEDLTDTPMYANQTVNVRKTNYHIHLIFSERKLLDEPIIKIASRNRFYDKNGKHVRTKKEILGEDGQIREGCYIVKKGEVYEKRIFTVKDEYFKSNAFLEEVKHSYTDLMNLYVKDDKQKLQVFERGGIYLATKKIGKNNPKAQEIESDNQKRQEWNRTVDVALISGVSEPHILEVKRKQISEPIKGAISQIGRKPRLFAGFVTVAIAALELMIESVLMKKYKEVSVQKEEINQTDEDIMLEKTATQVSDTENTQADAHESMPKAPEQEKPETKQSEMTRMASKYPRFFKVYNELEQQNTVIYKKEQQRTAKKKELSEVKGWFKGRKKKELQKEITELTSQIRDMKDYLPKIVQRVGYRNVQEFLKDFRIAKSEYSQYQKAIAQWKQENGKEPEQQPHGVRAKLAANRKKIEQEQKNTQRTRSQSKDRGAR